MRLQILRERYNFDKSTLQTLRNLLKKTKQDETKILQLCRNARRPYIYK